MMKILITILLTSAIWSIAQADSYLRFATKAEAQAALTKIEADMKLPIVDAISGKVITDKYAIIEEIGGRFYIPLHNPKEKGVVFNTAASVVASGQAATTISEADYLALKPIVNTPEELAIISYGK